MLTGFQSRKGLASTWVGKPFGEPLGKWQKLWQTLLGKTCKRKLSSESCATRCYREAKPREWTFPGFASSMHERVVRHVKSEKNSLVIVDPTSDDLVASVHVAARGDARRVVYLAPEVNTTNELCTELSLGEINDLKYIRNKLLVVVDDVDADKYYKHVDALVGIAKTLETIRLVILTCDPHVAKVCQKQHSKILYDQHNQMLSRAYAESKLGCNEVDALDLVMQSNSPSFVEYVSTHPHGSDKRTEVIEIGSANLRMMYDNMRKALA
jgi:hypothetical protein